MQHTLEMLVLWGMDLSGSVPGCLFDNNATLYFVRGLCPYRGSKATLCVTCALTGVQSHGRPLAAFTANTQYCRSRCCWCLCC